MEGPLTPPAKKIHLDRVSEQARLQKQLMAAAYERVCPLVRRTLAGSAAAHRTRDDGGELHVPPKVAAGA